MTLLILSTAAFAYDAEPQDFQVTDTVRLFDGESWSTGWYPSSGDLQLKIDIVPDVTATAVADGQAYLSWPEQLNLAIEGKADQGNLEIDGGYDAVLTARIQAFGFSIEADFGSERIDISNAREFDPFVLKGDVDEFIQVNTMGTESLVITEDLGSGLTLEGTVSYNITGQVGLEGSSWTADGQVQSNNSQTATYSATGQATQQANVSYQTIWTGTNDFVISTDSEVCYSWLGCLTFTPYSYTGELFSDAVTSSTLSERVDFGLPVADVAEPVVHIGNVEVGTTENVAIAIANHGQLALEGFASIDNPTQFSVNGTGILAPPTDFDEIVIAFSPTTEGEASAIVTLETNDPSAPTIEIEVFGNGVSADAGDPGDDPGDDPGGDPTDTGDGWDGWPEDDGDQLSEDGDEKKGCGCASASGAAPVGALALLAGLAGFRRRDD